MTKKANQASRFAKVAQNVTRIRTEPEAAPAPKMSRPQGKKRDPDYVQATVYIRKSVHRKAKQLLIDQEGEFSELVDTLVAKWVDSLEV